MANSHNVMYNISTSEADKCVSLLANKKAKMRKERKTSFKILAIHTVYRLPIDQPLDVRFRVAVGPTHQTPILIRG